MNPRPRVDPAAIDHAPVQDGEFRHAVVEAFKAANPSFGVPAADLDVAVDGYEDFVSRCVCIQLQEEYVAELKVDGKETPNHKAAREAQRGFCISIGGCALDPNKCGVCRRPVSLFSHYTLHEGNVVVGGHQTCVSAIADREQG